jgi:acyl-CoA thioester hydrolase
VTSSLSAAQLPIYRTRIAPDWIDYNGHLRDAYYGLIWSYATDEMMDHLGIHAEYRARTRCTLYTLEMHFHYLHEVKSTDDLWVRTSIIAFDKKRIHISSEFGCDRIPAAVAMAEAMMLHVQQGDKPASAVFPEEIQEKLTLFAASAGAPGVAAGSAPAPADSAVPGSRKIQLQRR